jgi:RimJ/RimL family protein N-acetyltransferase
VATSRLRTERLELRPLPAIAAAALTEPTVEVVVAGCDEDNAASVRTLERIGFRRTGRAGGEIRWRYDAAELER